MSATSTQIKAGHAPGLRAPTTEAVLAGIYARSETDRAVLERAFKTIASWPEPPTTLQKSNLAADAALPVAPEVGRLLYTLVRAKRPRFAVEFGSSFGASLIYMAAALRDNAFGHVTGTELLRDKAVAAQANLDRCGLSSYADIVVGDALEYARQLTKPVDFLLLDGWKELYLPVLHALRPALAPGAIVVSDNLSMLPNDFLSWIRDADNGFTSSSLSIGDGVELSLYEQG